MNIFIAAFGIFGILAPLVQAEPNHGLIAAALGWYANWGTAGRANLLGQTCRGERGNGTYVFRCDPLSVVVSAVINQYGNCSITNMRPAIFPKDGLHVPTTVGAVEKNTATCDGIAAKDGRVEFIVEPVVNAIDPSLTSKGRDAASKFIVGSDGDFCELRYPFVRSGDPFFDLYEACDGIVTRVWEFALHHNEADEFPQWTYEASKHDLPVGAQKRWERRDIWAGALRSNIRSPRK